jgi:tetratricopeptide (TPR) repeat protein
LGRVYAETDRVEAAIAEYKLGLSTDEDGSIHYQVARLYQKSGNKVAAAEAFKESKRLVDRRHDRARIALEQLDTDSEAAKAIVVHVRGTKALRCDELEWACADLQFINAEHEVHYRTGAWFHAPRINRKTHSLSF